MKILTHGNYIHFNDQIDKKSVARLIEEIEYINSNIARMKEEFHTDDTIPILLFINSVGGCVYSALGVCNIIENNPNPIITVINGESASAGTMLSIMGHRRLIYPISHALVHEGSAYIGGDDKDIDSYMHNIDLCETEIKAMYIDNTALTSREYNNLCIDDKTWDAKTCLKYGLVDKIIHDASKLRDWKWLLNITSLKKKEIKRINRKKNTLNKKNNKLGKAMKTTKL